MTRAAYAVLLVLAGAAPTSCATVTDGELDAITSMKKPSYIYRPGPVCSVDDADLQVRATAIGSFVSKWHLTAFVKGNMAAIVFLTVDNDVQRTRHREVGGTGFAVGKVAAGPYANARGIMTNYHVVKYAKRITGRPIDVSPDGKVIKYGKPLVLKIVAFSEKADMAYLVPEKGTLNIRSLTPRLTHPAFLTEVLWHFGLTTFCDFGMVSHVSVGNFAHEDGPKQSMLLTNGGYGDSGSPIVDSKSMVVGVTVGYLWPHLTFLPIEEAMRAIGVTTD